MWTVFESEEIPSSIHSQLLPNYLKTWHLTFIVTVLVVYTGEIILESSNTRSLGLTNLALLRALFVFITHVLLPLIDSKSFLDTLQKGLRSQFFEVNSTLSNSIRFLPTIPSSKLKIRKMSILHSLNTTSSDLDSSFFAMGILSTKVLYATFDGLLSVTTPGFYVFRFLSECDDDRVGLRRN